MKQFTKPLPMGTHTEVAVARHPLHPMLVTFPIAFYMGALAADLAFVLTADHFWARAALWLLGSGTVMGALAALSGTVELLLVRNIRRRPAGWTHFAAATMLLSVEAINWFGRMDDPIAAIVPGGLYLSALGAGLVALAGWLGGKLVFEHHVGIHDKPEDAPDPAD